MKFLASRKLPEKQRVLFSRLFDLLCEKHGISDCDKVVKFRYHRPAKQGDNGVFAVEGNKDTITRMEKGEQPREFLISIVPKEPRTDMLVSFCHEMIHLRQNCDGSKEAFAEMYSDAIWLIEEFARRYGKERTEDAPKWKAAA